MKVQIPFEKILSIVRERTYCEFMKFVNCIGGTEYSFEDVMAINKYSFMDNQDSEEKELIFMNAVATIGVKCGDIVLLRTPSSHVVPSSEDDCR